MSKFHAIAILLVSNLLAGCSFMQDLTNSENSSQTIPKKSLSTIEGTKENSGSDRSPIASIELPSDEDEIDRAADASVAERNSRQTHADLWQRMRAGFRLPHEANRQRVQAEL
jgi:hypothetical protein